MSHRTLLISAVLAAGASLAGLAQADIVAVDSGIAVKESDVHRSGPRHDHEPSNQQVRRAGRARSRPSVSRRSLAGNTPASSCISSTTTSFTAWSPNS
jgi:hypothetical protein